MEGIREVEKFNQPCWLNKGKDLSLIHPLQFQLFTKKSTLKEKNSGCKAKIQPFTNLKKHRGANKLLKEGLLWRVGNGSFINLWKDRQIPKPNFLIEDCKVKILINKEEGCWNKEAVRDILGEEMIDTVCRIPFCHLGLDDKLIEKLL